ncbi:MAG TPA: hypothetical protein VF490_18600 [Chryseosolibacter sp.]
MQTKSPLALILLLCVNAFAQENNPPVLTKDIGFNTAFIFQGILNSGSTPFSLMYKKYTAENAANRFGLNISFNMNDVSGHLNANYDENTDADIELSLGKERQKPINERWTWFYGGDALPFYSLSRSDVFQNGQKLLTGQSATIGLGLRPFVGVRFNINARLYLSAEASLNARYSYTKNSQDYVQQGWTDEDKEIHKISLYANPATGLFLYYRL